MPRLGYAYADATNAHTGLHQGLHELRHGSVNEAKQIRFETDCSIGECADGVVGL
jgi:hypothetical protein